MEALMLQGYSLRPSLGVGLFQAEQQRQKNCFPPPHLGPAVSIHSREQFPILLLLLQQHYSVLLA